jgi:hypothetical protein
MLLEGKPEGKRWIDKPRACGWIMDPVELRYGDLDRICLAQNAAMNIGHS